VPRTCTVCAHGRRSEIDRALVSGESYRGIAQRFAASPDAVFRHRSDHVPAALAQAQAAGEVAQADTLLGQLQQLQADARRIGKKAEDGGDYRAALAGVRELVRIVELTAKMVGELDERPVVTLVTAPEWLVVRAALLEALQRHPEARTAVAARLLALEASA
jgi:hypothetical protein